MSDGFLNVRGEYRRVLPDLSGTKIGNSVTVYDANVLGDLFDADAISWSNRLRPQIFTIQAVIAQDATVFKFTMQHAAGDAVGMFAFMVAEIDSIADSMTRSLQSSGRFLRRVGRRHPQALNESQPGIHSCYWGQD